MNNAEIADAFAELHERLLLIEKQPFRIRAYQKAADTFRAMPVSVAAMHRRGELGAIDGVGPAIVDKVGDLVERGSFDALDRAREDVPDGLVELTRVSGVGPKSAHAIWDGTGARTFADVATAARSGDLTAVKGVGAKAVNAIIAHADDLAARAAAGDTGPDPRMRRDTVEDLVQAARLWLGARPEIGAIEIGGAYARGHEVVEDIPLLVTGADDASLGAIGAAVDATFAEMGWLAADDAEPTGRAVAWIAATGAHVTTTIATAGEHAAAFTTLVGPDGYEGPADLPYELRDQPAFATGEREVPGDLLQLSDFRAELHCHSTWSDGTASIREMAVRALERGDTHMAMTDHSAPYGLVNGLGPDRLAEQAAEIAMVNEELAGRFTVLRGSEVEVLADGSLGLDDDTLRTLDWVVASIHVSQRQSADEINARMRRVMANPLVDQIGHPTSRLLLARPSTALDVDMLIELAVETGIVLELNANPHRLDLDAERVAQAIAAGVRIVINSDAHSTSGLDLRHHGVAVARRAVARRSDVVNCLTRDELEAIRPRNR